MQVGYVNAMYPPQSQTHSQISPDGAAQLQMWLQTGTGPATAVI
jgi:hypothetical protein